MLNFNPTYCLQWDYCIKDYSVNTKLPFWFKDSFSFLVLNWTSHNCSKHVENPFKAPNPQHDSYFNNTPKYQNSKYFLDKAIPPKWPLKAQGACSKLVSACSPWSGVPKSCKSCGVPQRTPPNCCANLRYQIQSWRQYHKGLLMMVLPWGTKIPTCFVG